MRWDLIGLKLMVATAMATGWVFVAIATSILATVLYVSSLRVETESENPEE